MQANGNILMNTQRLLVLAGTVILTLSTGCAIGNLAPSQLAEPVSGPLLKGSVHGGQQPVYGAAIRLYAAGAAGYGLGATNLLTAPVTTNAAGGFNISGDYTCPSATTQVYLTATGGDPSGKDDGSINNQAIQLVAALGPCGNLSPSTAINVNEITTTAAAFALGQFYGGFGSTTDSVGAPVTNSKGLINAFATANTLANTSNGTATPTAAAPGTNYFLPGNDQLKLNTIANILADCVNQISAANAACTTLFSAVTPNFAPLSTSTPATAPANIFQAAVYMSLNPLSSNASLSSTNIAALYALASAYAPFAPSLGGAPTDWTLAVNYTGTGISYLSSAAVDANGDLWFSNANASPTGGVVMLNGGTGTVGGVAGTTGGDIGFYTSFTSGSSTFTANGTRQVAIDQNGYAWFPGYTNLYLFKAQGGIGTVAYYPVSGGPATPYAIAVDPSNNVLATTSNTYIVSVPNGAASGTNATPTTSLEGSVGAASLTITPGSVGYAPTNAGSSVYSFSTTALTATSNLSPSGLSSGYGSALDGLGRIWMANKSGTSLVYLTGTAPTSVSSSCLNGPAYIAIDGNNNVWVSNSSATTILVNGSNISIYTVCEFNSSGTLISSSTGFGQHGVTTGRGIAVDLSGNVWVTSYVPTTTSVTEIVGAAVPVVNPISVAVKNSTVGTRP